MTKDRVCKKCSQSIDLKTELFTVCEGDCACFFHANCVGLSEQEVIVLSLNIIWLCDECMDKFRRMRDGSDIREDVGSDSSHDTANSAGKNKTIEDEVTELKDAIAGIRDTLSKLVPTDSPTHTSHDPILLHSTPVSSSLLEGTNACSTFVKSNDDAQRQQCTIDGSNFSLLLTNIDVSVAECDIRGMVTQALGIDTLKPEYIDVTKLVPHWRSCNAVDYISFKVVLNNRWKNKAMNPSTWPKGVKFREFIKRQRNDAWKPIV